ncbi:SDR family NAD(P)-dependent oxidoreductase [Modestobacter sp. VKM Ac-2985]|uniref:SDR family NAD(P)-dependent oxidoreductase n=1 Tax=Modestobacter sp. VKM Ac-2985 TaxID=3004139 RepID=UPI0022ABAFBA|nr:SDR family NAD(P)-dependent oxidoreductase [Modestobacter sp. VKM Ac-2985]MCZ2836536.1 SDR family NAD(P)-dependent oxidoreductase [Modestobacter sp. VKM Ac-2985]
MTASGYEGKWVLVTGSRRGLGRLMAEHVLRNGGRVAGFARGESTIDHPDYVHFRVDVGDPASVVAGFAELRKVTDSLQIVVNNAAVLTSQYSMIMAPSAARAMLDTNLLGAFLVSREASKLMRRARWGRIISISSMAVSLEPIGDSMYAATKAGLTTMTNVMARELAPLNITCNTLAVSAIATDMLAQLPQEKVAQVVAGLPLPRLAEPDDVFNVLDFLAAERSSYVTAQTIYLGGAN